MTFKNLLVSFDDDTDDDNSAYYSAHQPNTPCYTPTNKKPTPVEKYIIKGLPEISRKDMPELLAARIFDIAERTSSPPEYAYTGLVIAISTALGTKLGVSPKQFDNSYYVSTTLWGVVLGPTGSKKSPVLHLCMKKIHHLHTELQEKCQKEISEFKKQKAKLEKEISKLEKNNGSSQEIGELIGQMQDLLDNQPVMESVIINDATKEALQKDTGHSKNGILLEQDEIGGLFRTIESADNGYREFLLESWNGTEARNSSRVGTGHSSVERNHISILGGIQPDKFQNFMKKAETAYSNDGWTPRFQMTFFPEIYYRDYVDRKENEQAEKDFDDLIEFAFKWKPEEDPNSILYRRKDNLISISFEKQAQAIFVEWYGELQKRIFYDKKLSERMKQHLNKYDALMVKIALVYHVTENYTTGKIPFEISKLNVLRAISMCEILERHAKKMYQGVESVTDNNLALIILEKIKTDEFISKGMTISNMHRLKWAETREEISEALNILIDKGWMTMQSKRGSQRPTDYYAPIIDAKNYLKNEHDYIKKIIVKDDTDMLWTEKLRTYQRTLSSSNSTARITEIESPFECDWK